MESSSFSVTPASSAMIRRKAPGSLPIPNRGSISTLDFRAVPLFTSRSMWMATLGMTSRSRSTFTRRAARRPPSRTITRPATDRGRSSQERMIIPP